MEIEDYHRGREASREYCQTQLWSQNSGSNDQVSL